MASWPTASNIKTKYSKLNWTSFDSRLADDLTRAIGEVRGQVSELYDVSSWGSASTSVPQVLVDLVYPIVYGYITLATHIGTASTSSDEAGNKAYEEAMKQLAEFAKGARSIIGSDGTIVTRRSYAMGKIGITEPAMGIKDPINYGFFRPATTETLWR